MILTGRDIKWYIETGLLKIEPVKPEQFQQNGIDLFIKHSMICLECNKDNDNRDSKHTLYHQTFFCHGHAHLTETVETIEMPNDLMAFVGIRSSWARCGIFPPGTIIDAGFNGTLTIELFNGGPRHTLTLEPQRVIHLIFAKLTGPTEPYRGKYQGQSGITLAKEDERTPILPKVSCYNCKGTGLIFIGEFNHGLKKYNNCIVCKGAGKIG